MKRKEREKTVKILSFAKTEQREKIAKDEGQREKARQR